MNRTRLTIWVAAAVAAIGTTAAAVTVANATSDRSDILTRDQIERELAAGSPAPTGSPATPGAGSTAPATSGTTGEARTLHSRAGQVVARCDGDLARLDAWSPNPGYRVDEVVRGPAVEASVWIESDSFEDVLILVRCQAGEPQLTEQVEPDDHGGDDHDDDDGHGGRGRG
jgi:hypothetical protein